MNADINCAFSYYLRLSASHSLLSFLALGITEIVQRLVFALFYSSPD